MQPPAYQEELISVAGKTIQYFTMQGDLLYSEETDLKVLILDHLKPDIKGLAVDLSRVTRIDSYALGVLAGLTSRLAVKGARLILVGANGHLQTVLERSSMMDIFIMADNREQAVGWFNRSLSLSEI